MTHAHTFTRHSDIQNWVVTRHGMPAIARSPNSLGLIRSRLTLKFDPSRRPTSMPTIDEGMAPVSWNAWLAELDRQHLALRVTDSEDTVFELVARKDLN